MSQEAKCVFERRDSTKTARGSSFAPSGPTSWEKGWVVPSQRVRCMRQRHREDSRACVCALRRHAERRAGLSQPNEMFEELNTGLRYLDPRSRDWAHGKFGQRSKRSWRRQASLSSYLFPIQLVKTLQNAPLKASIHVAMQRAVNWGQCSWSLLVRTWRTVSFNLND